MYIYVRLCCVLCAICSARVLCAPENSLIAVDGGAAAIEIEADSLPWKCLQLSI